ncbi:MAG: ADP-forming succinate--CoA ligase subunit beta [Candidatus Poribacteria bacterium]|nr:ADP-forming succinate--CoA ligase subunit beta [Candidatus Poribacteria bacterium]MDE0505401.1 ADP-forming succinate--CoA ligase subunit beta [Candidatus Poribacteria bacterium]
MNIHEYQAIEILKAHGVNVPNADVASTPAEAEAIARKLDCSTYVVKAQIHAGGRGKGGGVKLAKSPEEVRTHADAILGMQLVTHQTGPQGKLVSKVLVAEASEIVDEFYLGMVLDRAASRIVLMGSDEGGINIEEVASTRPEKIFKEMIDPTVGLRPFQARRLAYNLAIPKDLISKAASLMSALYATFIDCDCSLVEINPLAITKTYGEQDIAALDAKLNFDDNALWRQPDIECMRDPSEEDSRELEASESGLSYISLEGDIGCMVNGAGLAMATMDLIKLHGGEPANFLDVGGGATTETVAHAFRLILADKKVKAVLVNIFGGIMKCDVIANGIIEAVKQEALEVPLIVRLEGTNVEIGKELLTNSGLNLITADGLAEAARQAVAAVQGN